MYRFVSLLALCVGVATARLHGFHGDFDVKRPIITRAQQQRICADLCTSGLGGKPCGDVCFDLMPRGIPLQSSTEPDNNITNYDAVKSANTRSNACPVLCENQLGYPLCQCHLGETASAQPQNIRVDFHKICDHYCAQEKWLLRGCPKCPDAALRQDGFQALFKQDGDAIQLNKMVNMPSTTFQNSNNQKVDWGQWCNTQCANSNGGSACNCDILPFSL